METVDSWLETTMRLARNEPILRQPLADALGEISESMRQDQPDMAEKFRAAVWEVLAMIGPLATPGKCMTCGAPEIGESGFCCGCLDEYGANPEAWPSWLTRIADDRAATVPA